MAWGGHVLPQTPPEPNYPVAHSPVVDGAAGGRGTSPGRIGWHSDKKLFLGLVAGVIALVVLASSVLLGGLVISSITGGAGLWNERVSYHSDYGYTAVFPARTWDCTNDGTKTNNDVVDTRCSIDSHGDHMTVDAMPGGSDGVDSTYENWSRHISDGDPEYRGWEISVQKRNDGTRYVMFYGPASEDGIRYYNVWISGSRFRYMLYFGSKRRDVPVAWVKGLVESFQMD